jgi:hypothetical protein
MRTFLLVLALSLACASVALAQGKRGGVTEFRPGANNSAPFDSAQAARRKAALGDMKVYVAETAPKPRPFPWGAVGLAGLLAAIIAPVGYKLVLSTRHDLEAQATFGWQRARPETAENGPRAARSAKRWSHDASSVESALADAGDSDRTARDAVWEVLATRVDWIGAERIASQAKLSGNEAAEEVDALVEEGHVSESRDPRSGKPTYRLV